MTDDPNEPFPSMNGGQGADAGVAFSKLMRRGEVILDFFGGKVSKYENGISINPQAVEGFKGTIQQFKEIFKGNKFTKIIADNPFGYDGYLNDAADLLQKGGTITITAMGKK